MILLLIAASTALATLIGGSFALRFRDICILSSAFLPVLSRASRSSTFFPKRYGSARRITALRP